jgi:4-hydroxybenzoate polyprenyltransferase
LNFLRLIRFPNLVILFLSQVLVRYCIIIPAYKISYLVTGEFPEHLSKFYFGLLSLSTLLIAAGGYIINDIFDQTTDGYNKPGKNQINRLLKEKTAFYLSYFFFGTGIVLGFIVALHIGKPLMGMIQVFSAFSLYMYSSFYQKRVLSGNLLIAFLTSLAILIIGLYEPNFYPNFIYIIWYAGFAFTLSFIREVVKDMEDLDGDEKAQYLTYPVRYGIKSAKRLAFALTVIHTLLITYVLTANFYDNKVINFWQLLALFVIPFIALGYLILKATEKQDYRYISIYCKVLMVAGILSMIGFWHYFLK